MQHREDSVRERRRRACKKEAARHRWRSSSFLRRRRCRSAGRARSSTTIRSPYSITTATCCPGRAARKGLFHRDTRYLSHLYLTIAGARPMLLSSTLRDDNASLTCDLTNPGYLRVQTAHWCWRTTLSTCGGRASSGPASASSGCWFAISTTSRRASVSHSILRLISPTFSRYAARNGSDAAPSIPR